MRLRTEARAGRLLAVFAHPDDETYLAGAARYYVLRSAAWPSCSRPREATVPPPVVTTTIAIDGFGERKLAATRCHRSQRHLQPLTRKHTSAILTAPEVSDRAIPAGAGGAPETRFHGIGTALVELRPHGPSAGFEKIAGPENTGTLT